MGNDNSKPQEREGAQQQVTQRSLPPVATRQNKELVSNPLQVDPRWYDTPDTPTSDLSFSDSDIEDSTQTPLRSHDPRTLEDDTQPPSQSLHQLLNRFVHGSASTQLLTGTLEPGWREHVRVLASSIGFESCHIDASPMVLLQRPQRCEAMSIQARNTMARHSIDSNNRQLRQLPLKDLDGVLERCLGEYLHDTVMTSDVTDHDMDDFILSADTVKSVFQKVAAETDTEVVTSSQSRIALVPKQQQQDTAEKQEKVIQKGELVWRRLQHWSTNVRKEKKFNIWAKGLPDDVKNRILGIAIEIGFETAQIQPNGNIHLEIKPPEGQHRRKLKHATDDLRRELEPIDEAVCQNVEQHLKEWLTDFVSAQKSRDVLNCRFVLPAEWLRTTSERLATQHGLCVSMETGIELIFHRPDVDPKLHDSSGPSGKDVGTSSNNKKGKGSKGNKGKKKGGEALTTKLDENETERMVQPPFEGTRPLGHNSLPILNRRPSGRGNSKYGWDPNWPTAHPDRTAATTTTTTQQRTYG